MLDEEAREQALAKLDDELVEEILNGAWWATARPEQLEPEGDWHVWLMQAGRGWGKTRSGAEWLADEVMRQPEVDGAPTEWAIIGQTFAEVRDICLDGPSGFLRVLQHRGMVEGRDFEVNRASWQVTFFPFRQKVHLMGAKDKDVGRGYNLAGAWLDEFGKWRYADVIWTESLGPALRIGSRPRVAVTTTPKPTVKQLQLWNDRKDGSVVITRGSTFDNRRNLSRTALIEMEIRYANTRIGRQELYGELISEVEGALFTARSIEANRIHPDEWDRHRPDASLRRWLNLPAATKLRNWRTVIAVDPPGETAECGIAVVQAPERARYGIDHAAVLADESMSGRPEEWGQRVVAAYRYWGATAVFVEKNQGGDMVRSTIHAIDSSVPVTKINAIAGKVARAEPVSVLYEKNLIHHIGFHPKLEDQLLTWSPDESRSPDRLDALVHAVNFAIPPAVTHARVTPLAGRSIPTLRG